MIMLLVWILGSSCHIIMLPADLDACLGKEEKKIKKNNSVGRTTDAHLYVHGLLDELHSVLKLLIKKFKYYAFDKEKLASFVKQFLCQFVCTTSSHLLKFADLMKFF